jgi:drug/metabolite transporter (DMT)-like permease
MLTGLGAALSWGTMDIASALSSRLIGSLRVTAAVQLIGAGFLVPIALVLGMTIPADLVALAPAGLLGLIGAGAYFAYFTGLREGPISVVSGMVAAYGGLTVVLSVVIRGETLTELQAIGATIATAGVILTGVAFDRGLRATRFAGPGVAFAVVALVLFAMMAITMDIALETAEWISVLLVSRLVIGVVASWRSGQWRSGHAPARRPPASGSGPDAAGDVLLVFAGRSMPLGSSHSRSGYRTRRPGWSASRRRSGRPSRSSWRSPSWRAAQADPVARAGRRRPRDDRDRVALTASGREAEPEARLAVT